MYFKSQPFGLDGEWDYEVVADWPLPLAASGRNIKLVWEYIIAIKWIWWMLQAIKLCLQCSNWTPTMDACIELTCAHAQCWYDRCNVHHTVGYNFFQIRMQTLHISDLAEKNDKCKRHCLFLIRNNLLAVDSCIYWTNWSEIVTAMNPFRHLALIRRKTCPSHEICTGTIFCRTGKKYNFTR